MAELSRIHASAPYYAGLLTRSSDAERTAALFEAALDGTGRTRREAAGELLRFLPAWEEPETRRLLSRLEAMDRSAREERALRTLRAMCLYKLGRFADLETLYPDPAPGPWDRALLLLASARTAASAERKNSLAGELADFFLAEPARASGEDASGEGVSGEDFSGESASEEAALRAALEEGRRWLWRELGDRLSEIAGPGVASAAAGRLSVRRRAYGEGLAHFRKALAEDETLFFRYHPLLGDLGRAFVFSNAQAEGMTLFLDWNNRIREGGFDGRGLNVSGIRYYIFYYAGRIQRSLLRYAEASNYFAQALDFAPDPVQADACVWYILSISFQEQPEETASLVLRYGPRWNRDSSFADILDQLDRYLVANRRWNSLAELLALVASRSDRDRAAKYAYILGSAMAEGLFVPESGSGGTAEDYLRFALGQTGASLYYRGLAASRLGEPLPFPEEEAAPAKRQAGGNRSRADFEFLRGFFRYGAADRAFDFIAGEADRLSPEELRTLAAAFAEAGLWEQSIRTVSCYAERKGYRMTRQDLELHYPRVFTELTEAAAAEENLNRELLFGLIRTESAFSPGIRSRAGAAGLAQLMSSTAADMAERVRRRGGPDYAASGTIDLGDPETNLRLGAAYLRYLMDRTESPLTALLAYNGGIGRLRRWRNAEPSLKGDLFLETVEYGETREYGRRVIAAAAAYGYLYYDMAIGTIFADIYN
jgi:soluble lytic murein transglycosylase